MAERNSNFNAIVTADQFFGELSSRDIFGYVLEPKDSSYPGGPRDLNFQIVEPFEVITFFAVQESGYDENAPMNAAQLTSFLQQKLDRRRKGKTTLGLVLDYIRQDRVSDFYVQLLKLQQRVTSIKNSESGLTSSAINQINEIIKVLEKPNKTPRIQYVQLSYVVERALDEVASQGPLSKPLLVDLITQGKYNESDTEGLIDQLNDLLDVIQNQIAVEKFHFDVINKRIEKTLSDLRMTRAPALMNF